MFLQMIRFEWRYYRRQPSFYVTSILFFLLAFFATASDNVQIGGGGEVWGNGPFGVIWDGCEALRDVELQGEGLEAV